VGPDSPVKNKMAKPAVVTGPPGLGLRSSFPIRTAPKGVRDARSQRVGVPSDDAATIGPRPAMPTGQHVRTPQVVVGKLVSSPPGEVRSFFLSFSVWAGGELGPLAAGRQRYGVGFLGGLMPSMRALEIRGSIGGADFLEVDPSKSFGQGAERCCVRLRLAAP